MKSLYYRLKEEGITDLDYLFSDQDKWQYYSDLYLSVTPETTRILRKEYPKQKPKCSQT